MSADPMDGLTLLERGWLSSNNLLIHAARGEPGSVLVDSGHANHQAQTVALVRRALGGPPGRAVGGPLALLVNTHLHSDHCGGNAAVQATFGVPLAIPPGQADAVTAWDERLSHVATGQRLSRFGWQQLLTPGEPLRAGGRDWQVLAAPGHDTDSVMLFDADHGVLVSADALWENGFGVVFPEVLEGDPGAGFDDVQQVLDLIASLPVRVVVPGHGRAFADVDQALGRARERLAAFRASPDRHARHAVKVMLKYHLMEEGAQDLQPLLDWAEAIPMMRHLWRTQRPAGVATPRDWVLGLLEDLAAGGAVRRDGDRVVDLG